MFCHFLLWHSLCSASLFSFCNCDNGVLSGFSVHVVCVRLLHDDDSCCTMLLSNSLWIESKLWLTRCSKVMYSSYDTEIEMTTRAHMSVMSRLLLRNVFLTASSHFKSSAFNNVCSKVVRCLANGFLICFRVLRYESLSSSILSHCTHVEADWSASQWSYDLKLCLTWYKPQFKVWPDLKPTLQANCVSIRTAHWHCCLICSHSI
jgi:hypothetical protein